MHPHGNVDRTQLLLVADAAEHEELGGVEPTRREDDLAVCPEGLALAVPHAVHAHGMVPLQEDAVDLGVDQDRDVLPREDGVEEGARHAVATAFLDDLIHVGEAVAGDLTLAVQVIEHGQADLAETVEGSSRHGQGIGRRLDPDWTAGAAEGGIRGSLPVLDPLEELESVPVAPSMIATLGCPVVEVSLERPGPDGGVDARSTAWVTRIGWMGAGIARWWRAGVRSEAATTLRGHRVRPRAESPGRCEPPELDCDLRVRPWCGRSMQ